MKKTFDIVKYSGEIVAFDVDKLIKSLSRSKAQDAIIDEIVEKVKASLYDGITTKEIYQMAFNMLNSKAGVSASRYNLKKAIMQLGPSGFPFEKFAAAILQEEGFETKVGVMVQGKCVQHEVDIVASKADEQYMVECKYHSDQGKFCDVKIPLYIQSRFLDIADNCKKQKGHEAIAYQGWVFTNTRFTSDAINYATCVGLMLLSWDYPVNNSLKQRIDRGGLHPLTALTSISGIEKSKLLEKGIVLCKEIHENPMVLKEIGIDAIRNKKILDDCLELSK